MQRRKMVLTQTKWVLWNPVTTHRKDFYLLYYYFNYFGYITIFLSFIWESGPPIFVDYQKWTLQAFWPLLNAYFCLHVLRFFFFPQHLCDMTIIFHFIILYYYIENWKSFLAASLQIAQKTPLEELFTEEEAQNVTSQQSFTSIKKQVERELQMYQESPPTIMSEDPAAGWWNQQKTYLASSYLCGQASSTPRECVFYLSRTLTHPAWEGRYDLFFKKNKQELSLIVYCSCC